MFKIAMINLIFLFCHVAIAAEIDRLDIESHPQSSFPSIKITIGDKTVEYYGMDSAQEGDLKFIKQESKLKGELTLSGYIFAKEFVESFRIPNTVANKKKKDEFVKILSEKDPKKLLNLILSVDEKWRTANTSEEIDKLEKLIEKEKTQDSPSSTPFFPTGFVELKSPKDNNERYFIKVSDVNKETMELSADKSRVNLLKSISIYSFQNILQGLNFGDLEKGSDEDKLFNRLENLNNSVCTFDCPLNFTKDLSELALNVGKVVSFEVVGNDKIENMDDFNKYVLAQQWCLLNNFSNGCHVKELDDEIKELALSPVIKALIQKHTSSENLCKFLQK